MLYKYIRRQHMEAFFRNGALKIGSLYEYRALEELGSIIGDASEGVHITRLDSTKRREFQLQDGSPEAAFFKKHILGPDQQNIEKKVVLAAGATLMAHSNSPNYYIYCVSSEYDERVMRQFGCDRCIEIVDPERFFKAISKNIRHKASFEGCFPVSYGNKTTDHLNPHEAHPALLKDDSYSDQKEIRAIWKPFKEPKGSLFINAPKAARHCREYRS
ncbi:MAG: hypothetical protein OER22_08700 [Gammaproteobacteria bacterium]|nr:hypothetical protein [Gammaproteobacteria bacterium]MDH3552677.1 hypothetical protein [Gammaproteobacteria bacterium]